VTSPDPVHDLGVTWNSGRPQCGVTGGGVSTVFPAPSWQQQVPGGLTNTHRMVPDVASLAGDPGYQLLRCSPVDAADSCEPNATYQWGPTTGDSMTGPFYAAAMAALRSDLVANGIAPPTLLAPALYAIANNPVLYPQVFRDVVSGNNDLYGVGCCTARPGYDLTTGLGQVDFANLASALAPPVVTFTG
jgi:subtilase family serine protease